MRDDISGIAGANGVGLDDAECFFDCHDTIKFVKERAVTREVRGMSRLTVRSERFVSCPVSNIMGDP